MLTYDVEPRQKRELGFWTTMSLVVGNMVGTGVFLLPASLAPYSGLSLLGWVFSGGGALLLALVFARLAFRLPRAGGPYAYTRVALGDFAGFLVAWSYWLAIMSGNAAISVATASYLTVFFPVFGERPFVGAVAALSALWLLTIVNVRGVASAGRVQLVTTVLKLLPLLAVAIGGALVFEPAYLSFTPPAEHNTFSAVTACAALTLWAFLGMESATVPAEHVRDAARTIPRATVVGTALVAVFYVLCTTAVMGVIPAAALGESEAPFADAARLLWGDWAAYLVAAGAVISCVGTLNGWILLQGQLPHAVAQDGLFPAIFARLSPRGTPALGLVTSSTFVSVFVLMNYTRGLVHMFTFIILLATLSTLIPYLFSAIAELMVMRQDSNGWRRQAPNVLVAMLAFIYSAWAVAGTGQEAVYWGFLLLIAGLPVYVWQTAGRQ